MSFLTNWMLKDGSMTSGEQQENYERLQAEYENRLNARRQDGTLNEERYALGMALANDQLLSQDWGAVQGFGEGLKEAAGNLPGTVRTTLQETIRGILRSIPWELWLIGLAVLFIYAGGFKLLERKIAQL